MSSDFDAIDGAGSAGANGQGSVGGVDLNKLLGGVENDQVGPPQVGMKPITRCDYYVVEKTDGTGRTQPFEGGAVVGNFQFKVIEGPEGMVGRLIQDDFNLVPRTTKRSGKGPEAYNVPLTAEEQTKANAATRAAYARLISVLGFGVALPAALTEEAVTTWAQQGQGAQVILTAYSETKKERDYTRIVWASLRKPTDQAFDSKDQPIPNLTALEQARVELKKIAEKAAKGSGRGRTAAARATQSAGDFA